MSSAMDQINVLNFDLVHMWCIFEASKSLKMTRQSITLTKPNNEWLKSQVISEEYSSKSEINNHLIRRARQHQIEIDNVRTKLIQAEKSDLQISKLMNYY